MAVFLCHSSGPLIVPTSPSRHDGNFETPRARECGPRAEKAESAPDGRWKGAGRPEAVSFFAWRKHAERLPVVLSVEEVANLLKAVPSASYRMMLRTMYASGLRICEACRLQMKDLDTGRGVIWVIGKGGHERQAALHPRLREALRTYWLEVPPGRPWLFTGRIGNPLDPDQARKVFKTAVRASGLTKRTAPHALRHTYATLLLEQGTDLRVIQALLGHATIRSTEHYLHVATNLLAASADPLELLPHEPG